MRAVFKKMRISSCSVPAPAPRRLGFDQKLMPRKRPLKLWEPFQPWPFAESIFSISGSCCRHPLRNRRSQTSPRWARINIDDHFRSDTLWGRSRFAVSGNALDRPLEELAGLLCDREKAGPLDRSAPISAKAAQIAGSSSVSARGAPSTGSLHCRAA